MLEEEDSPSEPQTANHPRWQGFFLQCHDPELVCLLNKQVRGHDTAGKTMFSLEALYILYRLKVCYAFCQSVHFTPGLLLLTA